MSALEVLAPGPLATVQDLGRPGLAHLGVGRSGAADRAALRLANRLVGNPEGAAGIEATLGGLVLRARGPVLVALTGAPCPAVCAGRPVGHAALVRVPDGAQLALGPPAAGLRTYVAVRGGLAVYPVLGSRSTDTLSGLGPPPLVAGTVLPVGPPAGDLPALDQAPVRAPSGGDVVLEVLPGPRSDWYAGGGLAGPWTVSPDSDRVGVRLLGTPLARLRDGELPSEGAVRGALQVPPSGQPVLLLADAPVTGGYPVVAVVASADVDRAAQVRPGQRVLLRATGQPDSTSSASTIV